MVDLIQPFFHETEYENYGGANKMNKNFCPNCGKKIRPDAKFCPYCGKSLVTVNNKKPVVPTNVVQPNVNVQQTAPVTPSRENVPAAPKKPKGKKALIWIILILIVLGVGGYFVYQHHQTATNDDLVVNKMSKKQLAGLTIAYAHKKYPKNKIWNDAYNQAVSGSVEIMQRKKYSIGNTEYKASKDSYVYVINKKAVFTMSNAAKNSERRITIADDKKVLGQVKVIDAYKAVKKDNDLSKIDHIKFVSDDKHSSDNVTKVNDDNDNQDEDDQSSSSEEQSSESQSSSSSSKDNSTNTASTPFNLKPFVVPSQMVGKWYFATSDGKVQSLVITNNSIDGKPIYQKDDKITNSSKFLKSSIRSKVYLASMSGGYVEYGVYGVDGNRIRIKDGHLVQEGGGGELDYYRTPQAAKNNPSE